MEKNRKKLDTGGYCPVLTKWIRMMKVTAFFTFIAVAQVYGVGSYSEATQLTLDMKNATVKEVLYEIEEISEFFFLYSNKLIDVKRRIDIKVKKR